MAKHDKHDDRPRAEFLAIVADLKPPPIGSSALSPWDETFDPERPMHILPPTPKEWVMRAFDDILDELERLENETTEPGDGIEIDIDALLAP